MGECQEPAYGLSNQFLAAREIIIGQKDDRIGLKTRQPVADAADSGRCGPIRVGLAHGRRCRHRIDSDTGRQTRRANEHVGEAEKSKGCQQSTFHSLLPDADALPPVYPTAIKAVALFIE
jgi:hypothetical protein